MGKHIHVHLHDASAVYSNGKFSLRKVGNDYVVYVAGKPYDRFGNESRGKNRVDELAQQEAEHQAWLKSKGAKDADEPRLSRSAIIAAAKARLPMVRTLELNRGGSSSTGYYYYLSGEFKPIGKKRSVPITGTKGGIYVHRVNHLNLANWVEEIVHKVKAEYSDIVG